MDVQRVDELLKLRMTATIDTPRSPEAVAQVITSSLYVPGAPPNCWCLGWATPERFEVRSAFFSKSGRPIASGRVERLPEGARLHLVLRPGDMDRVGVLFLLAIVLSLPVVLLTIAVAKGIFFAVTTFPIVLIAGGGLFITWWGHKTAVDALVEGVRQMVDGRRSG